MNEEFTKSDLLVFADHYDSRVTEYIELAYQDNIDALALDKQGKIGYTLKTMSAALYL